MGYSVYYSKAAERYLDWQTTRAQERIMDAIDALSEDHTKKLQRRNGGRLAVGGVRVLFDYVDSERIDVIMIAPRGDVTVKYRAHLILLFLNALNWIVLVLCGTNLTFITVYVLEFCPSFIICWGTVIAGVWLVLKRRLHIILFLLLVANVVIFVLITTRLAYFIFSL